MKNEVIAGVVNQPVVTFRCRQAQNTAPAPVETVGRTLGYTAKETAFAADVLDRFVWRRPREQSLKDAKSNETEATDSACHQGYAA